MKRIGHPHETRRTPLRNEKDTPTGSQLHRYTGTQAHQLLLLPSPIYTYTYGLLAARDLLTVLSYYDYNSHHLLLLRSTSRDGPLFIGLIS